MREPARPAAPQSSRGCKEGLPQGAHGNGRRRPTRKQSRSRPNSGSTKPDTILHLPRRGQARDRRGRESPRLLAHQCRQCSLEIIGRQPAQMQDGENLRHLRRPSHVARKKLTLNRWRSPFASTRRSFTRGARTSSVPLPVTSCRASALPFRPTCARPHASRALRCCAMQSSTSASSACCSILSAPRAAPRPMYSAAPGFASDGFATTLSMSGVSFARRSTGTCALNFTRRIRRLLSSADPQHSVISPANWNRPMVPHDRKS
jgi:hypothetical protein